jgi:hypothetical protein
MSGGVEVFIPRQQGMQVKQLSILVDQRPERMNDLMRHLIEYGVELHYLMITTDANDTIVRGLAPDGEAALQSLQEAGFTCFLKDILAVGVVQGYPSLMAVLSVLTANSIATEQISWVFSPAIGPFLLLVIKDLPSAQKALRDAGYVLLDEDKICRA